MKSLIGLIASLVLITVNSYAAQSLSTKINGPYSSIRALGMGNAFTAVADDYSLIMYNPAGFARKKNNEIQVTLLGAGVSSKTLTVADDIKKASDTPGTDSDKAAAVSEVLEKYYGQSLGGKLQAVELFWIRNGWGIALLPLDLTIDLSINKQLGPALDLNVKGDTTAAFGFGKSINKYVDAGITVKYIHRVSVEEIVPAFELATDPNVLSEKRFREGSKFDFDLGALYRPNWFNKRITTVESVKTETITTTATSEPPKLEEKQPEEAKSDEVKSDEKKSEAETVKEERKPQAEGDATDVKVTDEETLPVESQPAVTEAAKTETPTEVKKAEVKKNETKTVETSVAESEEKFPLAFGFVVHNVIGGEFSLSKQVNKNATEVPSKLYRVIDLGSQYLLRDGEDFKIRAMIDFQNLLHPEITLNKSFHAGVEFDYSPNTWFKTQLRAGLNQLYFTGGASFLFGIINIDLATYGEEVGTTETKIENRVIAAKLGFNF